MHTLETGDMGAAHAYVVALSRRADYLLDLSPLPARMRLVVISVSIGARRLPTAASYFFAPAKMKR